jgi:transcriptional regulator with XRE-family HTH domain
MRNTKGYLYKVRKELKLSQKEMAKKLYLSSTMYFYYENGMLTVPDDVWINALKLRNNDYDKKILACLEKK